MARPGVLFVVKHDDRPLLVTRAHNAHQAHCLAVCYWIVMQEAEGRLYDGMTQTLRQEFIARYSTSLQVHEITDAEHDGLKARLASPTDQGLFALRFFDPGLATPHSG